MEKKSAYYNELLNGIDGVYPKVVKSITEIMETLKGKVCVRMYHDYDITETRYTYFEVDGDGYGRALFLDTVTMSKDGNVNILLNDAEDCYEPVWNLDEMNTVEAIYVLEELEEIAQFHEDNPDKEILTEYDADFDWEEYLAR